MQESEILNKVDVAFDYLFDRFEYRVIACKLYANAGNWIVVLESPAYGRLLLLQDEGEVIMALGPQGSPVSATDTSWFDFAVVVEYLSEGRQMVQTGRGEMEEQLAELAGTLHPYMGQIRSLFAEDFSGVVGELNRIGARREAELRATSGDHGTNGHGH